ncbi:MAG TPA: hypothetical protein PLZ57_07820 [Pseudobdellovibrionaceae bacterium]|nr:hypothetical protein [Pseudobdellovibrionaceae bacterium]
MSQYGWGKVDFSIKGAKRFMAQSQAGATRVSLLCVMLMLAVNSACAHRELREQRLAWSAGAFAAGAAVGHQAAPSGERKELHAVYWGALSSLATLVVTQYALGDEEKLRALRLENEALRAQFELMRQGPMQLIKEGTGRFKSESREAESKDGSKSGITADGKGRWKLYKIDRWRREGDRQLVHEDQLLEVLPLEREDRESRP